MKITILDEKAIKAVYTMKDAIADCKEAAKLYSIGQCNIPLRANLNIPEHNGQSLYMYGYVPAVHASGVKIVSVYPDNIQKGLNSVPATMVLLDAATGVVSCLMDGTVLTRIRTGAIVGAATDILARKDSTVFALFGTGGQALSQLEAVLNVRPIKYVKVYDIDYDRAKKFAFQAEEMFGQQYNVNIRAVNAADEAVQNADIITTVTTATHAVFPGDLVKEGTHINGVGSYRPDMSEIDEYIITHAKVYVDTRDGALKESGNLLKPIKKGVFSANSVVGEIGDVLNDRAVGRENATQLTFFETTGSAVFDLVTAQRIYEKTKN